jgi:hypothetical protein
MNVLIPMNDFDKNSIFYSEQVKNTIIENSYFVRIIYSTELMSLNNISIIIPFKNITDKHYNKYTCWFDVKSNMDTILKFQEIERNLLEKLDFQVPLKFNIYNQLMMGQFKYISNYFNSQIYVLKISGICISPEGAYLTFKFIKY